MAKRDAFAPSGLNDRFRLNLEVDWTAEEDNDIYNAGYITDGFITPALETREMAEDYRHAIYYALRIAGWFLNGSPDCLPKNISHQGDLHEAISQMVEYHGLE